MTSMAKNGSGEATVVEGNLVATGLRCAIVASRFNSFIVEKLVGGALDALVRHGADKSAQTIVWAPGAWEIPLVASRVTAAMKVDAVICVGCVIRGGTAHFEHVAGELNKGIAALAMKADVPITNGVLTVENLEQAIDRAGAKMGNKGWEAATAAIETVNVLRALPVRERR
jgi:6,7-dimethyl-8-ribityllumazine synthase